MVIFVSVPLCQLLSVLYSPNSLQMVKLHFSGKVIYTIVCLIAVLLLINTALMYRNNQVIVRNKVMQEEADSIKLLSVEMMRTLHLLDLGLRGYAISASKQLLAPYDSSIVRKDRIMNKLQSALTKQGYPMQDFKTLRSHINDYYGIAIEMKSLLDKADQQLFKKLFDEDRGFTLQRDYRKFLADVQVFENSIARTAKAKHAQALLFSYWMQGILFLLCVPTLLYLAHYANKTFWLAEELNQSQREKAELLTRENKTLEDQVQARTNDLLLMNEEIVAQNEEIISQNEEIVATNDQLFAQRQEIEKQHDALRMHYDALQEAHKTIASQHTLIQQYNKDLVREVESQTKDLLRANVELKERNAQLEQFTYVISHNLRGPMSRIQGLAGIMAYATNEAEVLDIGQKMNVSTQDMDRVIKDLTMIMEIRNINHKTLEEISLPEVLAHAMQLLQYEIHECRAIIDTNLQVKTIYALTAYAESIFYNLISNAIKYRSPDRHLVIQVFSYQKDRDVVIEVRDNGLGIDMVQFSEKIFVPYKRFHLHVPGRGLGLYLVKTQVESLEGKLEVESTVNEGTVFKIYFPSR